MAEPNTSSRESATAQSRTEPDGNQQGGIVNRMKESATARLTNQRDRGIDAIGSVAQAVRSSGQQLRDDNHETLARYVEKAADQVETWSERLRHKNVDDLVRDVQRFARRQPAVFVGSAFAVGIIAARFLKSSRPESEQRYSGERRREQFGGRRAMSTAADRGFSDSEADVANDVTEVAILDVEAVAPETSAATPTTSSSSRTRRSSSRTERERT